MSKCNLNIKISAECASFKSLLSELDVEPFAKPLKFFFDCAKTASELISIESDFGGAAGTSEVRIHFEPTDIFYTFLAAVRARDWDGFVIVHNYFLSFVAISHPHYVRVNEDGTFTLVSTNQNVNYLK